MVRAGLYRCYSYSASFAVALSGRPIREIGRIWADGKLLRGAAGDFKSETGFRVYAGHEDQPLDPLIAATEGLGATPAYRGIAYAVFENMALASFGNRIPSISFEIIADPQGTTAGNVLFEIGRLLSDGGPSLTGLAVTGDSVRGVAESIAAAAPFSLSATDRLLQARFAPGPPRLLAEKDLGGSQDKKMPRVAAERVAAAVLPEIVTLAYNDVGRDFLVGAQRAKRDGSARRELRLELAAALDAGQAKAIAEARLARFWAEQSRATLTLPSRSLSIAPGEIVLVPGLAGKWRVTRTAFEAMVVRLHLVLVVPASQAQPTADPGRVRREVDLPHGATELQVIDLPQLGDAIETSPFVAVLANGATGGWRRAALTTSIDGGRIYADAGTTALPAVIGHTASVLPTGDCSRIDRINSVDVQLVHPGLTLSDADGDLLLAGANLAMIGDETLQFGLATPLGSGRWRLSELWRGRRGTEWAATGNHEAGAPFALLEAVAMKRLSDSASVVGVTVMASGVGDVQGVVVSGPATMGANVRPLAPVHAAVQDAGGDVLISWIRRSRDGWRWRDAVDVPVGEESEAYRIVKSAAGRPDLSATLTAPAWTYTAAERALDVAAGAPVAIISITQIGALGVSRPLVINIPIY